MRVLVSGASIAGPTLAYWLCRNGFSVAVVERSPALRKAGGHAVDLFKPAMDIAEKIGVIDAVEAKATGTEIIEAYREGSDRRYVIEIGRLMSAVSDRHVEIMRDDLSQILYDACPDEVDFRFGDSITQIAQDDVGVEVKFESGASERFDLVIGADGLHSNVRRLVFGPESDFATWIGAYLAVASVPNYQELQDRMVVTTGVDRMAGLYSAAQMDDARAVFMFRPPQELDYDYRDIAGQKLLLRKVFDGLGPRVTRLLDEADRADAFYLDSITQLRMDSWSRGRVSLVGDAGYCPGPAVGGSTSLAMVGAYVLAGELAAADGDYTRAFAAYEEAMRDYVLRSREFAMGAAKRLLPSKPWGVWAFIGAGLLVGHLPVAVTRALTKATPRTVRLHDSATIKDYWSESTSG
ncbi:FAD-dependent monooxygenase [Mycobacterium sp. NPDC051804]|uniref:FAD-dependent monooxygenase n=1 Tax=Mycobacterium sp. NPDC051804 TaxID=3364295 RepID=UPI0037B74B13